MVLYQVISTYQLLNAIVHKEKNHPEEKCVLIISKWLTQKHPNYEELNQFFDKIIIMDASVRIGENFIKENSEYCKGLLRENRLDIGDFSEIHAMGCHYSFGIFLTSNKIPYYFWEDASGITSRPEVLYNIYEKANPSAAQLCEQYKLFDGSGKGVIKRYCNQRAQKEGFDLSNTVNFEIVKELEELEAEKALTVRRFFTDAEDIVIDGEYVLLLTQHFFNLKVMSFSDQALIYQLFVDYFFPDKKIVFKTHPDDLMYYGILFPSAEVIRKKFPSEFLTALLKNPPHTIATVSSTAIDNLRPYFENSFSLNTEFETGFKAIHRYAVCADIKKNAFSDYKTCFISSNETLANALMAEDKGDSENSFYIVDDGAERNNIAVLLENARENDVYMLINSGNGYCFYDVEHKALWEHLHPISISKKKEREEDFYSDEDKETVYLFSKNAELAGKLEGYSFKKQLKNTGLLVEASFIKGDEKKIALLNALLSATENMLMQDYVIDSKIDEKNVFPIRYSDPQLKMEDWDESQRQMRIIEGIIKATEARLIFKMQSEN